MLLRVLRCFSGYGTYCRFMVLLVVGWKGQNRACTAGVEQMAFFLAFVFWLANVYNLFDHSSHNHGTPSRRRTLDKRYTSVSHGPETVHRHAEKVCMKRGDQARRAAGYAGVHWLD